MKRSILILIIIVAAHMTWAQVLTVNDDIQLVHLKDSVFMHISWHKDMDYGRFSSNGLVIIRSGRALLIDTPIDNEKTASLVMWLKDSLMTRVTMFIPGHFHDDCLGELEYLHNNGVKSLANSLTVDKCRELHLPVPSESFTGSKHLNFYGKEVECRYFGPGHTFENIVIWLPQEKILFGGCLLKSIDSTVLGNLSDAAVNEWDLTVRKLSVHYKDICIVIPGHGEAGGPELLKHTINLVEVHNSMLLSK